MNDDPFELPLFDPPEKKDSPDEEASPQLDLETGQAPDDEPVVVEKLELDELAHGVAAEPEEASGEAAMDDELGPATLGPRLAAGIIDLMVHGALLGALVGGSSQLGVDVGTRHAVPLAVVLLLFSYLYHVVPLVFWGNTPGMAVAGLRARTMDYEPLSLSQAVRRWLALLLTAATGGLGTLLALGGRSLADRLSESRTLMQ